MPLHGSWFTLHASTPHVMLYASCFVCHVVCGVLRTALFSWLLQAVGLFLLSVALERNASLTHLELWGNSVKVG
jgi:hypothetical protein